MAAGTTSCFVLFLPLPLSASCCCLCGKQAVATSTRDLRQQLDGYALTSEEQASLATRLTAAADKKLNDLLQVGSCQLLLSFLLSVNLQHIHTPERIHTP